LSVEFGQKIQGACGSQRGEIALVCGRCEALASYKARETPGKEEEEPYAHWFEYGEAESGRGGAWATEMWLNPTARKLEDAWVLR
jgi:hypothetical protein